MMRAWGGGFGVCVLSAALLVAGCSGGGKQSAATTATSLHKPDAVQPCPKTYPNVSLARLNAGVAGLDKELVPLEVTKVWTCRWNSGGRLNDGGYIGQGGSVTPFVTETNKIPTSSTRSPAAAPVPGKLTASRPTFLTFAGPSQQVTLRLDSDGVVTNGVLFGVPTVSWLGYFLAV